MAAWSDWLYGPKTVETFTMPREWDYVVATDAAAKLSAETTVTATGGKGYATEYPFLGYAPPGCCGQCDVIVDKVEILWWPDDVPGSGNTSTADHSTSVTGHDGSRLVPGSTTVYKGATL
jgi:hypothetical protein